MVQSSAGQSLDGKRTGQDSQASYDMDREGILWETNITKQTVVSEY